MDWDVTEARIVPLPEAALSLDTVSPQGLVLLNASKETHYIKFHLEKSVIQDFFLKEQDPVPCFLH